MVKTRKYMNINTLIFIFFSLISIGFYFVPLSGQGGLTENIHVTAEIDTYQAFEGRPLRGNITITHDVQDRIDESSFRLEDKPVKVDLVKTVRFSTTGTFVMAIYHFNLPAQPPGLYMLPVLSVKVGNNVYQSIPSSYEVRTGSGAATSASTSTSTTNDIPDSTAPPTLTLKSSVDGPTPIYPGQKAWFRYRFYFTGNIELVKEDLPLLEAAGFAKVGEKLIKESEEMGISIREVAQQVQAISPGIFSFPASFVEGYGYQENTLKQRTYIQPKVTSKTDPITITVLAFPTKGKPVTFNGALGTFIIETHLLTPPKVAVDDKMQLAIDISGDGDLATASLPDLTQAGFKQLFRLSDLPPASQINGNIKRFIIEIYPLSTAIQEIPSVPFSYFDPLANHYETVYSPPIPIIVTSGHAVTPQAPSAPSQSQPQQPKQIPPPPAVQKVPITPQIPSQLPVPTQPTPSPATKANTTEPQVFKPGLVEIKGNVILTSSDLQNLPFGTWNVFWIIPLGISLLIFQIILKKKLEERRLQVHPVLSADVFTEAMRMGVGNPLFFQTLDKAFMLRLVEHGLLNDPNTVPEDLPKTGIVGEVRSFLYSIEEKRFTGDQLSTETIVAQAKKLFEKIKNE